MSLRKLEMIIHHKGNLPRGYNIKVTCRDELMVDMIHCSPTESDIHINLIYLKEIGSGGRYNVVYRFMSGAVLKRTLVSNEYEIEHYGENGYDGLAAIEELRMLDDIRKARIHFLKMKSYFSSPYIDNLNLKVIKC